MANPVPDATVIAILNQPNAYPYTIIFRQGKQPVPLYPTVEVRSVRARSSTTDPETKTEEQQYEIVVKLKYLRPQELEEADLELIETKILQLLDAAVFEAGSFFFENKQWIRKPRPHPFGMDSTLNFTFRDVFAKDTGTVIGAGSTLTIGTVVLPLIRQGRGTVGRNNTEGIEDDGSRFPLKGNRVGNRFFEYKVTQPLYDAVEALCDAGQYVTATLNENGIIHTYTVLPVVQSDTIPYTGGVKTAILQLEIAH